MIPVAGLFAILGVAAYMVVQLDGQAGTLTGDFTNAAAAEVRDAQGQVVLNGQFQPVEEDDDDTERKAALAPTGVDADAAGEAEVEFTTTAPAEQEVEFSIRNVAPGAVYTFVIDGIEVGSATADSRGRAELEVDASMPGTGRR
jgi:hypothetical protein